MNALQYIVIIYIYIWIIYACNTWYFCRSIKNTISTNLTPSSSIQRCALGGCAVPRFSTQLSAKWRRGLKTLVVSTNLGWYWVDTGWNHYTCFLDWYWISISSWCSNQPNLKNMCFSVKLDHFPFAHCRMVSSCAHGFAVSAWNL